MSTLVHRFDTPEDAVRALDDACVRRDADGAVATRGFVEEARRALANIDATLATDKEILRQTAEVLELGYRKELHETTFERFSAVVNCTIASVVPIDESLVKILEDYSMKDGTISREQIFVAKTPEGWRVITVPS